VLPRALELAQSRFIQIAIESDLPPRRLLNLVEIWNHPNLTINYDSGNSASLGYSFDDEIELYGRYISDLHVKDRTKNGGSVEIGKGAVDFQRLVRFLSSGSFDGIVTMQAFRDQDGIQVFSRQLFSLENKAFEMGIRG
jgi:sugar phosphate isomerase/epimerase